MDKDNRNSGPVWTTQRLPAGRGNIHKIPPERHQKLQQEQPASATKLHLVILSVQTCIFRLWTQMQIPQHTYSCCVQLGGTDFSRDLRDQEETRKNDFRGEWGLLPPFLVHNYIQPARKGGERVWAPPKYANLVPHCNNCQFATICRNLPQFAAICCNLPQFVAKSPQFFCAAKIL